MSTNKKYQESEKGLAIEALRGVAKGMTGESAVAEFIDGLLTENEQLIIGRRVLVAQMLLTGHTYDEIKNRLHLSPNTFVRTKRWLKQQIPNYKEVLQDRRSQNKKRSGLNINPFSFGSTRKKVPEHFLLLNIAAEFMDRGK